MSTNLKRITAVLGVLILLSLFGVRVGHPNSGLSTALGSASSSVVIYKANKNLSVGDKIFGASQDPKLSPVLGEVADKGDDYYTVQNGKFLERITKEDTRGKMIVVIPFFGYLFNIVGL
ncbi:hypothetical protein MCEMRE185_01350 [Candidatus Nanopelagicaceae bacterium]